MNEHDQDQHDTRPFAPPVGGARPGLRIGDTEREDAVRRLGEHFAAGRLSDEEHAERTESAYAAKTQDDLNRLFGDLPGEPGGEQGPEGWGGPPWAQGWGGQGWGAQGWAPQGRHPQAGRPGPWGGPWAAPARCGNPAMRWLALPFVALAAVVAVGAIAHGFFFPGPAIPLLAIAAVIFFLNGGFRGGRGPWARGPWNRDQRAHAPQR